MEKFTDFLLFSIPLIIIPLALIAAVIFYLLKLEREKAASKLKIGNASSILKIRLQAYERVLLFLERISPQQLVVRNNNPQLSVVDFQGILISNIREEYEHNLVQQLYITEEAWSLTEQARSWVMKMVNDSASSLDESSGARELAMAIVEKEMKAEKNHIHVAIKQLKKEVRELF